MASRVFGSVFTFIAVSCSVSARGAMIDQTLHSDCVNWNDDLLTADIDNMLQLGKEGGHGTVYSVGGFAVKHKHNNDKTDMEEECNRMVKLAGSMWLTCCGKNDKSLGMPIVADTFEPLKPREWERGVLKKVIKNLLASVVSMEDAGFTCSDRQMDNVLADSDGSIMHIDAGLAVKGRGIGAQSDMINTILHLVFQQKVTDIKYKDNVMDGGGLKLFIEYLYFDSSSSGWVNIGKEIKSAVCRSTKDKIATVNREKLDEMDIQDYFDGICV